MAAVSIVYKTRKTGTRARGQTYGIAPQILEERPHVVSTARQVREGQVHLAAVVPQNTVSRHRHRLARPPR